MILLDITFRTTAGQRDAFLKLMDRMVAQSRSETGCLIYRLTASIEDPLTFHLLERWADEPSYLAHRTGPALTRLCDPLAQCSTVVAYERLSAIATPYAPPDADQS